MDYLNTINDLFPIRRSVEQKQAFRAFVLEEAEKCGCHAAVETLQGKHQNIVVGDPATAKVVFTAHYDTPASSLAPNIMTPRNLPFFYLYHMGYPMAIALFSLLLAYILQEFLSLEQPVFVLSYLVLYMGLFYLCNRAFPNKHNKNDNTSGVAALLSVISRIQSEDAAFILFDNEEKGLLGSKAYAKAHKDLMEDKLLINLDCVGLGESILVIAKEDAQMQEGYRLFRECLCGKGPYSVHYYPAKGSSSNSDHKNFKCGVGVMACKHSKYLGYYTPYIHTGRDTAASAENIDFLTESICTYIQKLRAAN